MSKSGLTISCIIEASSANYGESVGNIAQLKKMTRAGGKVYTYISRQALRYNIVQQMRVDNTPVTNTSKVVQFAPEAQIDEYPEIDLFGYMKTEKKGSNVKGDQAIRSAVVRLSNAVSLEPYKADTDFLTNIGLAKREDFDNAIAQSEIHKSFYAYTITVDLDKIGIDGEIEISNEEKSKRVVMLLDTIEFLYRDIRGRRENLNPVFSIGGVYERKNPYFEDRLQLDKNDPSKLNVALISSVLNSNEDTKNNTTAGILSNIFSNDDEIKGAVNAVSISEMFNELKKKVMEYYG